MRLSSKGGGDAAHRIKALSNWYVREKGGGMLRNTPLCTPASFQDTSDHSIGALTQRSISDSYHATSPALIRTGLGNALAEMRR